MHIIYFTLSLTGHRIIWEEEIPPPHTLRKCLRTIDLYTHLWRSISGLLSDVEGPAHCCWCHPVCASPGCIKPASWASHRANYYFPRSRLQFPYPAPTLSSCSDFPFMREDHCQLWAETNPFLLKLLLVVGFYHRLESSLGGCFSRTYQDVLQIGTIFWRNVQEFPLFGIPVNTTVVCSFCRGTDWGV